MSAPIFFYKTKDLFNLKPSSLVAVKADNETEFSLYVVDKTGIPIPLKDTGGSTIAAIENTDGNLEITTGVTSTVINFSSTILSLINSAIQSGDNISELNNDSGYITLADIPTTTFLTDFEYNLPTGKSLGKLTGTGVYPAIGLTQEQFLREIAIEYINAVFTSFTVAGQATTVEVGTTLSGIRTFNWGMTLNNAIIPTIDIYDNTTNTVLVNTPNDNSQSQNINTILLNSNNATQSWKGIGINTNGANINSSNFIITSQFYRYWGAVDTLPANPSNGTDNRVFAENLNKAFKTNGANSFNLTTGTTSNKFIVLLPPTVTITSVVDTGNLNLNITSEYILSTITIKDAGGTDRTFNQYLFNPDNAYGISTNHLITTN